MTPETLICTVNNHSSGKTSALTPQWETWGGWLVLIQPSSNPDIQPPGHDKPLIFQKFLSINRSTNH